MSDSPSAAAIVTENDRSLQRLIRAIRLSEGQFALILVRCNYGQLREQMLLSLRSSTSNLEIRELFLQPAVMALHSTIVTELGVDNASPSNPCMPSALMVFGLESVLTLDDVLTGINQARDIYAASFPFPLVLWLSDEVATLLSKLAPDFKSWAATTIKFELPKADLIALVRQETDSLFAKVLEAGAQRFLSNAALYLDPKSQQRREIESARNDLLRLHRTKLAPELEASLEFVLGRDDYANDQIDEALAHYQNSLTFWQEDARSGEVEELLQQCYSTQLSETPLRNAFVLPSVVGSGGESNFSFPPSSLLWQAVVLFHLGLCYRRLADLRPTLSKQYWQDAFECFKQCIEVFEVAQRPDLVAKFILPACEMLQRSCEWKALQELTQKSLRLHEIYGTQAQVAQDYGFLTVVALAQFNWQKAYELANIALSVSEQATDVSRQHESWYLLLLARTQRQLGETEEAVNNLEWARVVCELQHEPSLYLEILEELRSLYFFELHNYLEAFNLKQEKIQIEHQYGFRAFIGASQLQPQRYGINPALQQQKVEFTPDEVAQEIAASGRQQDVNRLIARITRADCKLTIIHGPSGVGKSSILKAGLVPALQRRAIGDRIAFPIILSVYTDWMRGLGRSLNQLFHHTGQSVAIDVSPSTIIKKIRLLSEKNYTPILILDQFEEFFFVSTQSPQRLQFYKFIIECLNIPFVKVIFSMREDYLHYLLDLERLSKTYNDRSYDLGVINNNILDKSIRYYLGNFSRPDAIAVIQTLTKRSHYELSNELVNQLVEDLAGELDEVHPIELQIVGAQLQAENITTLEQYKHSGASEKLVERWLEEVIKDCGLENEEISWKLLFELTDEKGTRPLKTKADLAAAVYTSIELTLNYNLTLDLILEILVGSGLVLRVREETGDRYQLVHDYLVEPIRQKNNYGIVAELEKVRSEKTIAEAAQKLSQEQLNLVLKRRLREARVTGVVLGVLTLTIGGLWWQADAQKRAAQLQTVRAERSETNYQISDIAASSEALFSSNKEFDALLETLRAWRKLKQANGINPDTRMRVVTAMQQAVYGVTEANRLEGHGDIVWGVTFSPDGKIVASGSRDKKLKIWRPDGTLIQTLIGHSDSITSVSFSPEGSTLASASYDKTVKLWRKDPSTGKFAPQPYKILNGHEDWVFSVSFSPDGELLATASKDKTIKLWHRDGTLITTLRGHQGLINWVSFSPDGQFIVSASDDKTVKVWRRDGSFVKNLLGHNNGVTFVTFSPDGQLMVSAGRDKTLKIWNREQSGSNNNFNFSPYKTLEGHNSIVWSVNFSRNGQTIASASDDNTVKLWSRTGILLKTFKGHSDCVTSVSFSPDNNLLASGSYDKSVKLWSLNPPTLPVLRGHKDRVNSVAWSPDGEILASASRDNTVKIWQRDGKLLNTLVGHSAKVTSVSFAAKGAILASGSYDKTVKLWRRDGRLLKTLLGHTDSVTSVSFSPDGQLLASASKDTTVKLWRSSDGRLLKTLQGHQGWVNSVNFSPDGQTLASASDDQTVKIWWRDGTLFRTFSPHDSWVLGVSFSPTHQLLASASWDNTVKLWRKDGTLLKTLLKGYSDSVNGVSFSPDGETLAAASWDSTVKLWSSEGKLIKTLNGHSGPVLGVSFSPDGQTIASSSDDDTIILWNLNLNDLLARGCNWVGDYLDHNRNLDEGDRHLCDGIEQKRHI